MLGSREDHWGAELPAASDVTNGAETRRGAPAAAGLWRRWLGEDDAELVIALAVLGALIELFLVILTRRFWLTHWFPGPGVSLGFPQMMTGSPGPDARWYAIVTGAPFVAFVPAVFCSRDLRGVLARAVVFGYAVVFAATLVPLYPIAAADIFHYVADARTLAVYHQNPLIIAPSAHPFFIGISFMDQPSPYGPFWQILSIIPIGLAAGSAVLSMLAFKVLAVVFFLLCAVLVYVIAKRLFPGRELLATLAFAWSPFITFRAAGNGHNDIVMMGLALLAVYYVLERRWRLALPILALSVCTKYATALMVPPILLYGWRTSSPEQRRGLYIGAAIAAAVTLAVFAPFWAGADTFKTFMGENNKAISSAPQLLTILLVDNHILPATASSEHTMRLLGTVAFVLFYIGLLVRLYRRPTFIMLITTMAIMFIAYLVLQKWWFRPWYFLWFLVLVAPLPSPYWIGLAVATGFGSTFFDMIEQYRPYWPWIWSNDLRAYAAPVVAAFLPLGIFLAIGWVLPGMRTLQGQHDRSALSTPEAPD